ncbi:hypothetical protein FDG50_11495 [Clostridium botulinum]|uniref:hypothetical protein n=1 Tax=Clostridium botulinum TaxID=1491 RepID=UPI0013FE561E|nr:hypothetical protein [Clostridium botulinum]MBY6837841.1 hypothetical protein [Clostridium botulinum]NFG65907.1 hypothetical protein [Clostridium botulinum]NFQ24733.1 hypothetical protein [Clostridium botulinum]
MGKVSCPVCGRIHDRNYICEAKKKAKLDKSKRDRSRLDNKVFSSSKWKKLRNRIVEDYNNIDLFSYYIFGKVEVAEVVHHIAEFMQDEELAFDEDNLIPLSNYTHLSIVHKLYKTKCKIQIQNMLRDMIKDWNEGNRELGSYKERYNKIVKEFGMNV